MRMSPQLLADTIAAELTAEGWALVPIDAAVTNRLPNNTPRSVIANVISRHAAELNQED